MRELISKFDISDDSAASALRVIAHFDQLVEQRPGKGALLRAAAALAGCTVGFRDPATDRVQRFDPAGHPCPADENHTWHRAAVPGSPGAFVWLEQPLGDGPLDALILERCALGIGTLTTHVPSRSGMEALRTVIDAEAEDRDRADAARRLGMAGILTAVVSDTELGSSRWNLLTGAQVISILPGTEVNLLGQRAGTAKAEDPLDLPDAVENARLAYRAADRVKGAGTSAVSYEELGSWAEVIRQFPPSRANEMEEVQLLGRLSGEHPWLVDTLQALVDQPSLRRAAGVLHVHHSTLQERVRWLNGQLGFDIGLPKGKARATLALLLWRISHEA